MSAKALRIAVTTVTLFLGILVGTLLFRRVQREGQHDFLQMYLGARLAASGQIAHIYDRSAYEPLIAELRGKGERISRFDARYFNRPTFQAFFYVPFTLLSYGHACTTALIINFGLLGILVWKLPIWFHVRSTTRLIVRIALAVFYPFLWSLALGQDTLLLTLLIAYALFLESKGHDAVGGLVMGLCVWKPHLTWLLPVALMAHRRWKMAAYCVATSAVLMAGSLAAIGMHGFRQWVDLIQAPSTDFDIPLMGNIRALDLHLGMTIAGVTLAVTVLCFCVILRRGALFQKISAALFTALLISPHTYWQDYSLAAIMAMFTTSPITRIILLAPWPYFYPRKDEIPMIFISLVCLIDLGMKYTSVRFKLFERHHEMSGVEEA